MPASYSDLINELISEAVDRAMDMYQETHNRKYAKRVTDLEYLANDISENGM